MKTYQHAEESIKLFQGEKSLVITGLIGVILAACIAVYIFFQGPMIGPEGNVKDAFSFNAAIGMFLLSIAAILPLTRFTTGKRKVIRCFLSSRRCIHMRLSLFKTSGASILDFRRKVRSSMRSEACCLV
ncbi:hypothetical protein [Bacillus thermotolerans]|uniref:hypothetical protein n=1 Tax=Bacillus thermotolerans TaxID=1221996 RepID=UPI000F67CD31|nr:hypothetical protein [Bacillus thermotolerans]